MSWVDHKPAVDQANFTAFAEKIFSDPVSFSAAAKRRIDSAYFLEPVQSEIMNLISLAATGGFAFRAYNATGATLTAGTLVYLSGLQAIVESGDTATQLSSWVLSGVTMNNTHFGDLYWTLTNSGTTRTVYLYKDVGHEQSVASGSVVGDGAITLTQLNSSGISGSVTVAYTADDTDSSNVLNCLLFNITKADADGAAPAEAVLDAELTNNTAGLVYPFRDVSGIDTSGAAAAGSIAYLSATAGGFTWTAPTGADQIKQRVGICVEDHATTGRMRFFPGAMALNAIGSSWLQNGAVTIAKGGTSATTAADARTNLGLPYASQAQQETGTETAAVVAPGTQKYHPSAAKAWACFTIAAQTCSIATGASFNVSSVSYLTVGYYQVNYTVAFSSANYAALCNSDQNQTWLGAQASGSVPIATSTSAGTLAEAGKVNFVAFGDQ